MFDIILTANEMFKSQAISHSEILYDFFCTYKLKKNNLPTFDYLVAFMKKFPEQDKLNLSFNCGESIIRCFNSDSLGEYQDFCEGLYDDDEVTAEIHVVKYVVRGVLNIYNLEYFINFLTNPKYENALCNYVDLFSKYTNKIVFRLLETSGFLRTNSIVFSDDISDERMKWSENISREKQLKHCNDATVFLDKMKYPLVPQDFSVVDSIKGCELVEIKNLFDKLRNILSYIYLANSSYIVNEKAVLQFDPSAGAEEFPLGSLADNNIVSQIYDWVFKDESCVDKASIARKIINIYCKGKGSVLNIDNRIFNSIKSDYLIYQKNHAEQYIDMKNKISDFIVDSVKQLQNITHDMAAAFKNNFVAILVFLMTVLLTDTIDFSRFFEKNISPNVIAVCIVFIVASSLYLIATIIMGDLQWKWLRQSYFDLKKNYKEVLDAKDIEDAFNGNRPLKTVKKQYQTFSTKIRIIWLISILVLSVFVFVLSMNRETNSGIEFINNVNEIRGENHD